MSARSHDPEAGSAASSDDTRVEAGDAQAASAPGEKSKAERAHDGSPGLGKEGDDRCFVDFDGPDDPERPINRSRPQAWLIILAICFASAMVTCTSSMVAATYEGVEVQFGVSLEVATLGLSLFVAGLGLSPLVLGPFSERLGRRPIYIGSLFLFTVLSVPVAVAPNLGVWLAFRFLTGAAGSAFLSVAGGSVSDLFTVVGPPMALFTAAPFVGPALGPILGFAIDYKTGNWRAVFYFQLGFSGAALVLVALCPETYAPSILRAKAKRIRRETGDDRYKCKAEMADTSLAHDLLQSTTIPFKLLAAEPMALVLDLWCAFVLGVLYLFFNAFSLVFKPHGFNELDVGLAFVGILVGVIVAATSEPLWSANTRRLMRKHNVETVAELGPEVHLLKGCASGFLLTIGLIWFTATLNPAVFWLVPILGTVPFGMGVGWCFTSSFTYLVAAYRPVAASAMAGNSFLRSCFAAAFPLFGNYMYRGMGNAWATGLLAFLSAACVPWPFLFYRIGPRLRKKSRFSA